MEVQSDDGEGDLLLNNRWGIDELHDEDNNEDNNDIVGGNGASIEMIDINNDITVNNSKTNRLAVIWRPHALFCIVTALAFVSVLAIAAKVDEWAGWPLDSWALAMMPLLLASIISLIFVVARGVAHFRGLKFRDHLDDRQHLLFWTLTALAGVSSISAFVALVPALVVVSPLVAWCAMCASYLGYVTIKRADTPKDRAMSVAGIVVLLLVVASLLCVAFKVDFGVNYTWTMALLPFFLLCSFALVGPILSCVALKFSPPYLDCAHQWNFQRADAAEAVIFGTAGTLLSLFLLPLLITVVLLLPRLEGHENAKMCIVALIPLLIEIFSGFALAFLGFVRSLRLCVVSWRGGRHGSAR